MYINMYSDSWILQRKKWWEIKIDDIVEPENKSSINIVQ